MSDKVVGRITGHEKNEIITFTERLSALHELELCNDNLDINEEEKKLLINKIKQREKETSDLIKKWWQDKYIKYKWDGSQKGEWRIDFQKSLVILTEKINL